MSCPEKRRSGEILELIAWGRGELSRAGIGEGQEECERILMKLLGCVRSAIYLQEHDLSAHPNIRFSARDGSPEENRPLVISGQALSVSGAREDFLKLIEKRIQRIPLAYLLKEADFWKETLCVDERCLIPRPETEILVEAVIREMKGSRSSKSLRARGEAIPLLKADRHAPLGLAMTTWEQAFSFLDIGTGSGAIAVALLREFPKAHGTLLDISDGALEVARINVEKYGLQERATFVQGDIFNFFGTRPSGLAPRVGFSLRVPSPESRVPAFDLIVSNPPYLSEADLRMLQPEVGLEPREALDGGKDGLDFYKRIVAEAQGHLTPGGLLALEAGQGQIEKVSTWLQDAGYDNIQRFKDYLGIERAVLARKAG
jgi:release factor glutamine methyltransferase